MFAVLDDMGKGVGLHVWLRENTEKVKSVSEPPDFHISNVNQKKALLNFLAPLPANVFPVMQERSVWLYVCVRLSEKEAEVVRALVRSKLTWKDVAVLEDKSPDEILNYLAVKKLVS
ncbi:MAG: hypothetical protein ACQCN4_02540 [Candidatus Bathyarchaeia archaeon]